MRIIEKHQVTIAPTLRREFNRAVIDSAYRDYLNTIPFANITEDKDQYHVCIAAPGMRSEDFKMNVKNRILTISCSSETEDENSIYRKCEFNYSSFSRTFTLPEYLLVDKIKSQYTDGIFQVNIPKKP